MAGQREERAWRGLMAMQDGLTEFRRPAAPHRVGISHADYQVLAHLSEAPEGGCGRSTLGRLLRWEKSRCRSTSAGWSGAAW